MIFKVKGRYVYLIDIDKHTIKKIGVQKFFGRNYVTSCLTFEYDNVIFHILNLDYDFQDCCLFGELEILEKEV